MEYITEILEKMHYKICDEYCKYTEQYESQYKDPDDATNAKVNQVCVNCPLSRL